MWVLPKNYHLSLAFAADTLESKEGLILLESIIGSSLMWKSKPSPLRTWLLRWKRVSWIPPLFGRILKPSHQKSFQEKLTSSLADTHANPFQQQVNEKALKMNGTFGHISENILKPSSQTDAFLKTSKAISRLDSPQSSVIWQKMVLEQRGEYSQRMKLAHHTKENGYTLWPTVRVSSAKGPSRPEVLKGNPKKRLENEVYLRKPQDGLQETMGFMDGQLNPDWVEWLMGVPIGWTGFDCLEME